VLDVERGDHCRRNRSHGARKLGVAGGAKKVRRPATWEVLCRLLARVSSQRRSVADTELAAVIAALYPERSFPAVHRKLAEDPLERGRSANAARMLSSPKHTPLRVRLRPGCPEPEDPLDGRVPVLVLTEGPLNASNRLGWSAQTRGGVRVPAEARGAITGS